MTKRLSDSDRRAVDLLLDRSAGAGNGDGSGYVTHAHPTTEPGIQSVQKVLNLLDLLPIQEPPADLMTRTLARIDARGDVPAQPMHPAAAMMGNRPHA